MELLIDIVPRSSVYQLLGNLKKKMNNASTEEALEASTNLVEALHHY